MSCLNYLLLITHEFKTIFSSGLHDAFIFYDLRGKGNVVELTPNERFVFAVDMLFIN